MYHYPNQEPYHQNTYTNLEVAKVHNVNVNSISLDQYQVLPQNILQNLHLNTTEDPSLQPQEVNNVKISATKSKAVVKKVESRVKMPKKSSVDTSNFSIEERLVAAVWVHERKHSVESITEIKLKFKRRFDREPPSKTTLCAWERKLFSTGNVSDAPRSGRPIHRKQLIPRVAASVSAAPALSLRARARALSLPRSTLHHILRHDLSHEPATKPMRRSDIMRPASRRVRNSRQLSLGIAAPAPRRRTRVPHVTHAMHAHKHPLSLQRYS